MAERRRGARWKGQPEQRSRGRGVRDKPGLVTADAVPRPAAAALPGDKSEKQKLRPCPRRTESEPAL